MNPSTPEVSRSWPNPQYAWYVVGVLTVAQTLGFIDRQIVSLLVGPLKTDLSLSDVQVSLLGGPAFALFYTLLGIPLGRLLDRNSRRVIVSAGVFFWSLATMACGLSKSFASLFMFRVGVGVGEATLSPGSFSIIADYFPPDKLTRPTSLYLTGVWLGTGLAFIMGGAVIDMVASMGIVSLPILGELKAWQIVFFCVGAPGLLFPIWMMLTVREPVRRSKIATSAPSVDLVTALKFVWANRRTYFPLFASLGFYAAYGLGTSFWTIEFFIREFGTGRSNISYLYGALAFVFGTIGSMAGGALAERLARRGVADANILTAFMGMCVMLPVSVLFPFMPSMELAAVGVAGVVFFTPWPYGPSVAAIQVVTPNEMRGFVSGLYQFVVIVLGLGTGPTSIALFTDYVFQSDNLLPRSLSATAAILIPAAMLCMYLTRKPFKKSLAAAQAWTER